MTLWMVRAGGHGEQEDFALEKSVVCIGWALGDLSHIHSRQEMIEFLQKTFPDKKQPTIANWATQIWAFLTRIQQGDLVCLPLKTRAAIAVGEVIGSYEYWGDTSPTTPHIRRVRWLKTDIPRSAFGKDILYSLGAFSTVCRIERNNAEARVREILKTGQDPGKSAPPEPSPDGTDGLDLEQMAQDQIIAYIDSHFKGHDLARLVAALLEAQGYQVRVSPPGADGGVDILAGQGSLGFGSPRICVQVKSGATPADVRVLRELQGVLQSFGAEMGLLVSWGGFNQAIYNEARTKYFTIRLWDANDLVTALFANYDRLGDDIQAELPLKRIWVLVQEEE